MKASQTCQMTGMTLPYTHTCPNGLVTNKPFQPSIKRGGDPRSCVPGDQGPTAAEKNVLMTSSSSWLFHRRMCVVCKGVYSWAGRQPWLQHACSGSCLWATSNASPGLLFLRKSLLSGCQTGSVSRQTSIFLCMCMCKSQWEGPGKPGTGMSDSNCTESLWNFNSQVCMKFNVSLFFVCHKLSSLFPKSEWRKKWLELWWNCKR